MKTIFFDNAATSNPKPPQMIEAISDYLSTIGVNPGRSSYRLARQADAIVSATRQTLSDMWGILNPNAISFTSNSTVALNMVIKGILKKGDHVVTTNLEHNSVLRPLTELKEKEIIDFSIVWSDKTGCIDVSKIEESLRPNTKLIIANHGSNVLGSTIPISEIGQIAKKYNALFLVDASQTAGLLDINVKDSHIDFLAFTGHKSLLGPSGVGGFYAADPLALDTILEGGTGHNSHSLSHPSTPPAKFEVGTLNYMGLAGLYASLKYLKEVGIENLYKKEMEITKAAIKALSNLPFLHIYLSNENQPQLPVISFNIKDSFPAEVADFLDNQYNICVRPGLHCAPLVHKTLGTQQHGTIRLSFGHKNNLDEIGVLTDALKKFVFTHGSTNESLAA
jgi:cysteine desulfurase/selenocysteine lyase